MAYLEPLAHEILLNNIDIRYKHDQIYVSNVLYRYMGVQVTSYIDRSTGKQYVVNVKKTTSLDKL